VVALSPTVTQVMELELGNLSSWGSYQLQFAPAPGGPWIDLGGPFTCNTIATTLSVNVSGNAGFFRVNHLP